MSDTIRPAISEVMRGAKGSGFIFARFMLRQQVTAVSFIPRQAACRLERRIQPNIPTNPPSNASMFASLLRRRAFTPSCGLPLGAALLALVAPLSAVQAAPYSQVIVFGDSLSDDGNFSYATNSSYDVKYPGLNFNYSNGRFTDDISGTSPSSDNYEGVWHEQLTRRFLGLTRASDSSDGGTDYAFADATTQDGTTTITEDTVLSITVNNMGQQVTNYLSDVKGTADGNALFIVWGGANDLFADDSAASVTATAGRVGRTRHPLGAGGSPDLHRAQPAAAGQHPRLQHGCDRIGRPRRGVGQLCHPTQQRARFHRRRAERAGHHRHALPAGRLHALPANSSRSPPPTASPT